MDFKKLFETDGDERAVSPVIGVILMVAITVILAAVIGAFVIGIGEDQEVQPTASFNIDFENDGEAVIAHSTGDTIESPDDLEVLVDGEGESWVDQATDESVSAGSQFEIRDGGASPGMDNDMLDNANEWDGETVSIVWTSETGDSSSTLSSSTAPNEA